MIFIPEEFQSGQMERTVNPSAPPSMVRIHPLPPKNSTSFDLSNFFIQAAGLAYHHDAVVDIIKGGVPPLYLIMRQRVFSLRLDDIQGLRLGDIQNFVLMIYTPLA